MCGSEQNGLPDFPRLRMLGLAQGPSTSSGPGLHTSKAPLAGAVLSIAHGRKRHLAPIKVWPHLGTAPAAGGADETRLDVGQPRIIPPLIRAQGSVVAATIVGAIDQHAPDAHVAHLAEGDLLGSLHGADQSAPEAARTIGRRRGRAGLRTRQFGKSWQKEELEIGKSLAIQAHLTIVAHWQQCGTNTSVSARRGPVFSTLCRNDQRRHLGRIL